MKDMKRTPKEQKAEAAVEYKAPPYPYGLEIRLTEEELTKLGLELPKVGTKIAIQAIAEVTSCSSGANAQGDEYSSCALQIQEMEAEPVKSKKDIKEALYGDDE